MIAVAELKTLTGKNYDEIRELLDKPLPASAYKKIPTAGNLTDIDSDWQTRVFNSVFGLCGLGWGYSFESSDMETREELKDNNKTSALAILKKLVLWVELVDGDNGRVRLNIQSSGANRSEFGNLGYAMKGAITSALGAAASKIGWQESIYLGVRSHENTTGSGPAHPKLCNEPATPPAAPPTPAATTTQPPATAPATPPAQAAATAPAAPALRFFKCPCGANISDRDRPVTCKCGMSGAAMKEYPTFAACSKAAAPEVPPAQDQTPTQPYSAAMHPCMACGVMVWDNNPSAGGNCPECGQQTIQGDSKALQGESKFLVNNDRAVWLRRASEVLGRKVSGYSEVSCEELVRFIRVLRYDPRPAGNQNGAPPATPDTATQNGSAPAVPPAPAPAAGGAAGGHGADDRTQGAGTGGTDINTMSKVNLVRHLFKVAGGSGLKTAAEILANMSQRWQRTITSSNDMTVDELRQSVREFEAVGGN